MTKPITAIGSVEADPENPDELLITFPPGFLEAAGFNEGDDVVWEVFNNTVLMRKQ